MNCKDCQQELKRSQKFCPNCGCKNTWIKNGFINIGTRFKQFPKMLWEHKLKTIVGLLILIVIGFGLNNIYNDSKLYKTAISIIQGKGRWAVEYEFPTSKMVEAFKFRVAQTNDCYVRSVAGNKVLVSIPYNSEFVWYDLIQPFEVHLYSFRDNRIIGSNLPVMFSNYKAEIAPEQFNVQHCRKWITMELPKNVANTIEQMEIKHKIPVDQHFGITFNFIKASQGGTYKIFSKEECRLGFKLANGKVYTKGQSYLTRTALDPQVDSVVYVLNNPELWKKVVVKNHTEEGIEIIRDVKE